MRLGWKIAFLSFWPENSLCVYCGKCVFALWREKRFCGFSGKCIFVLMAGKYVFVVLAENMFLHLWRGNAFFMVGKCVFVVLVGKT